MTSPTADGLMSRMRRKARSRSAGLFIILPPRARVSGSSGRPDLFPGAAEHSCRPLHPRGESVPQQLAAADAGTADPVELDHAPRAQERPVPVERVVGAP